MGSKRKPESPLKSEPSSKIRRIITGSDHENFQYTPAVHSPSPKERVPASSVTSTPAPLTKANLRQLEKMTRSGSKSGQSVANSKTGTGTSSVTGTPSGGLKSVSTTDHQFEAIFRANGGVSALDSVDFPPSNVEEARAFIRQPRGSASPTSSQHRRFRTSLGKAGNERDVENLVQGRLFKDTNKTDALQDIDYGANVDKQWTAFPKNVGFNNGLSAPKPDLVEGYAQRTFPPSIRQLGGAATLVHDQPGYVGLPHLAAEFKDSGKSMEEAEVQAAYDGAHMVYARNKALAHIEEEDPPRRASPITVASNGRSWVAYSHYAYHNDEKDMLEYYQHELDSGRTTNYDDFKRSYKVLRNVQDWSRKESDDLRDRMKRHEDLRAKQASAISKAGSADWGQASRSAYSSAHTGTPRAPVGRADDAGTRPFDDQASSSSKKSAGRPSLTGYAGTSRLGSKQQAPPSANKPMLPPPSRSSGASSARATDQRGPAGSPSPSRYPPSANGGSASGTGTPRSHRTPSVASSDSDSRAIGDRHRDRDRDRDRRPSAVGPPPARPVVGRDSDRYTDPRPSSLNQYRDRRSDGDIEPVQRRRSDSPQDKPRLSRPQDRDRERERERGRDRDQGYSRYGDSGRDYDRYDRATSVSGSSSASTRLPRDSPVAEPSKSRTGFSSMFHKS